MTLRIVVPPAAAILELDVGNTRVKWRLLDACGSRLAGGACAGGPGVELELESESESGNCEGAGAQLRARIACVAGAAIEQQLSTVLTRCGLERVQFARATRSCGRIRNGYQDPERLGVDRWLALVAAGARCEGPFMVVDAGSALTVDEVDATGIHVGGWIVPGLALMRDLLVAGTADVRFGADLVQCVPGAGRNTSEAVCFGTRLMARDFVQARWLDFRRRHENARLLVSGGDAHLVCPTEQCALEHVPELVLDGLSRVLD